MPFDLDTRQLVVSLLLAYTCSPRTGKAPNRRLLPPTPEDAEGTTSANAFSLPIAFSSARDRSGLPSVRISRTQTTLLFLCLQKLKPENNGFRSPNRCCSHQNLLAIGGGHGSGSAAFGRPVAAAGWMLLRRLFVHLNRLHHPFSPITRHHSSNLNHVLRYHHPFVPISANFFRWRQEDQHLRCQRLLRR